MGPASANVSPRPQKFPSGVEGRPNWVVHCALKSNVQCLVESLLNASCRCRGVHLHKGRKLVMLTFD